MARSTACGSFTFTTMSARSKISAASSTIPAPAARYSSSVQPIPSPALLWTSTSWPCLTASRTLAGAMPTRYSWFLISLGTPMSISRNPLSMGVEHGRRPARNRADSMALVPGGATCTIAARRRGRQGHRRTGAGTSRLIGGGPSQGNLPPIAAFDSLQRSAGAGSSQTVPVNLRESETSVRPSVKRLAYVLLLFVLWFVLSGHAEPYMLALGLASVGISVVLAARMRLLDEEGLPFSLLPRLGRYLAWLVRMIAASNVAVARIIVNPVLLISPTRLSVKSGARSDLG